MRVASIIPTGLSRTAPALMAALLAVAVVAGASHAAVRMGGGRGVGGGGRAFVGARGFTRGGFGYAGPRSFGGASHVVPRGGYYRYHWGGPYLYPRFGHYYRPRSFISFGFGFGYPYYYYPYYYDYPPPVIVEPGPVYDDAPPPSKSDHSDEDQGAPPSDRGQSKDEHAAPAPSDRSYEEHGGRAHAEQGDIDVTNDPPAGAFYYDQFCGRRFSNLDEYTDHLQRKHHSQTISVVDEKSGETIRTLEFVDGYWQVQQ